MPYSYKHESKFAASPELLFRWHEKPFAFETLCPPWMDVRVVERDGGLRDGGRVVLEISAGPVKIKWCLKHLDHISGVQFKDVQTSGPFHSWVHTHNFVPDNGGCKLEDNIEYSLPASAAVPGAAPFMQWFLKKELDRMFTYRQQVIGSALKAEKVTPMNVVVSGSHGLVGQLLVPTLATQGHTVRRMVRGRDTDPSGADVVWDPWLGRVDVNALSGADAVVHLAGENIASGRWTVAQKERLRKSRIDGTRLLCENLAKMPSPPKVLICASAVGVYGDCGAELVDESHGEGKGFLAELAHEWEAACEPAREKGIRVVNLRFGVILSPKGGALKLMLLPFRMGAGGIIGSGKQYMSWIAVDDAVGVISYALSHSDLSGPVNAVAPDAVTNFEYTKTLGKVLWRPTIFPIPAFAARLVFGQMADELLLASCRARPVSLQRSGYQFLHSSLESALRHLLGK